MSSYNTYIATNAAALTNPLTFDPDANAGGTVQAALIVVNANLDLVLDLISKEGMDESDHRLFLDGMSPAARDSIYAILLALKNATSPT